MADAIKTLNQISKPPSEQEAFDTWLEMGTACTFLRENSHEDEFVVYACNQSTLLNSILVPASSVNPPNIDDLMSWNCSASSSWSVTVTFSPARSAYISPPLEHAGSKILSGGEQLIYARRFEGHLGKKSYYEVLQKATHLFDLHFVEERKAYCRLDDHGEIEEVIRIVEIEGKRDSFGTTVITFKRALLDEYVVLTDSVLVRVFDFTRFRFDDFSGWSGGQDARLQDDDSIVYRIHVEPGYASYMRGFQIVRSLTTKESVIDRRDHTVVRDQQYASFIVHDWKNNLVREVSCAPGQTANYFTVSTLPFELSPAFFKPAVLLKYKADFERYQLDKRSISCRGGWTLRSYDLNDAGQVHAYLIDLRNLPYEEQLYWKSHNERPKAPISKRAFTTDFEGTCDLTYDPLLSLKAAVRELDSQQTPWWILRSESLLQQLHYPVTSSPDEWSSEILHLDQLLVEGFETKWLRRQVESLGRAADPAFRSLKLLEECLIGLGLEEGLAQDTVRPLREAHDLRSKVKGHASGNEGVAIKKQTLATYGSYKKHFHILCERCDESIRAIAKALRVRTDAASMGRGA